VIAHNHIYEVNIVNNQDWEMIGHRQRLLKGYGFDRKYEQSVNTRTKKTHVLKLNVQPTKVGFEDLFKVLTIFDLLCGLTQNSFGKQYGFSPVYCKINNYYADNLSQILSYYYELIPNKKFVSEVEALSKTLRQEFESFLPSMEKWDWFITNTCVKCGSPGFFKHHGIMSCIKCGTNLSMSRTNALA
jgi:hypothetical protein